MLNQEQQRRQMMAHQQAKIEAVEKRAADLRKKKAEKDAEWRKTQRQRELNRVSICHSSFSETPRLVFSS